MARERGFSSFRKTVSGTGREKYLASCQSCVYMEEYCVNTNVTSFDMVETETNKYCCFWKGYMTKDKKRRNDDE